MDDIYLTDSQAELRRAALDALALGNAHEKCAAVWAMREITGINVDAALEAQADLPGRPALPELVAPAAVPRRAMSSVQGRAALLHALAHIEFNAINLALDILWRFPGLPEAFYRDWSKVAVEEATHFDLLARRLQELGYVYGDFPAHNGLWEMAEKTRDDLLARLALVPRTLEARGLDVSPAIRHRLAQAGDHDSAAILDIILRDEVGHVAIGNHWYKWLCTRQQRDFVEAYETLSRLYQAPRPRGPFNLDARRAAGFDDTELEALQQMAQLAD
ncbi:ferritin-like domain-containing protein [Pusillimonas sp. MFBS29]|uniref:ferritin-like domain-containing protein n=1 Tax=Pusillimonas sp. MFBS29 TaxID=2886690 RepID=UPI001D1109D1|nr:ferritin-like domain-containing protein [Pusillimonas sp. MFBS29]MCC2595359.1 ferritin-like domain-containing protein [Pusillimonas sp. MFBS29]